MAAAEQPESLDAQESRLKRELLHIKERWLKRREEDISYLQEAAYDPYNLITVIGLGGLTAVSAVMMPPFVPIFGSLLCAWELSWLTLASQSDRFRRSVRARKNAAALARAEERRDEVLTQLPLHLKAQHEAAQAIAREIRKQAENLEEGDELLEDTLAKLDYLLENYGRMLLALHRIQQHQSSPEAEAIQKKVGALQQELTSLEPGRLRTAKEKNLEVLRQRLDRSKKSQEEKEYLEVSLDTLENTLKLVRERVIAASSGQGVTASLDDVIVEMGKHRDYMDTVESQLHQAEERAAQGWLDMSEGPHKDEDEPERERARA